MKKQLKFSTQARTQLAEGVNNLAKAVVSTLGPSGRNVLIDKPGQPPTSTKDGVSVAKEINLEDPVQNMGAQTVKQAASKTNNLAGDGTTTSTLLASEMFKLGLEELDKDTDVMELKNGINFATEKALDFLEQNCKEIDSEDQLNQVATISANNDKTIGSIIASAVEQVGTEGVITAEESKTGETYLETVEGIQFDRGYKSPYFVTDNNSMQAVLNDPYIMILDSKITSIKELLPSLEGISQKNKPLLLIAEDIDGEALSTMVVNKMRGILQCVAVKAPDFGDRRKAQLEDIATLTGGKVISKDKGMRVDKLDTAWLGKAKKATVGKEQTTIIDAAGEQQEIEQRVESIKTQVESSQSPFEIENLQNRLAKFVGGVAVIHVGGYTEVEMKERKDRVDDALHATRAALEEGIVPGGGLAFLNFANTELDLDHLSESAKKGVQVVIQACSKPFYTILYNAGYTKEDIVDILYSITEADKFSWQGYNPKKKQIVDMFKDGIIDPTKVTRLALENASSVAGTLLTTEATIQIADQQQTNQEPVVEDPAMPAMNPMM